MDLLTYPYTFHNYDKKRVLIQPRGPDPVYYGVRGSPPPPTVGQALPRPIRKADGVGYLPYKPSHRRPFRARRILQRAPPLLVLHSQGLVVEARRTKTRHLLGRLDDGLEFVVYRHLGASPGR